MTRRSKPALAALIALPLLKLALHLWVGRGYGYHGDEFYYLVCADHLDFGYVDHPPLSILVLALTRLLVGSSVSAIRVVPAAAGALTVLLIGLTAEDLGAHVLGMTLAMLAALVAPFYLSLDQYFSMNALDILCWSLAGWVMLRILTRGNTRLWPVLGVLLGLGLENKISALWLIGGLTAGLLLTSYRTLLVTRGPWLAVFIALALASPYAIWQLTHQLATLHFIRNAADNNLHSGALSFGAAQVSGLLPAAAPVWIAGLAFLLFAPAGRAARPLGWTSVAVLLLLAFSRASKAYYGAVAFPWLLAAGGVAIERWANRPWRLTVAIIYAVIVVLSGIRVAPIVLPILPEATIAEYSQRTGAGRRSDTTIQLGAMPEFLGMMSGWDELVDGIAAAYRNLPAADRASMTILAPTYQIAAAIDVLGRQKGLPPASSGHNNYWIWGFQGPWTEPFIVVGHPEHQLREWFREITPVGEVDCRFCPTARTPIYLARGPIGSPHEFWRRLQRYE
jgi:hypothetical protein